MNWFTAATMVGGLGLFLFGLQMMASGMQKIAGERLRRILEILTGNPVAGIFTGLVVTLLIQSSSSTTVMLIGFVNAGLMSVAQAFGPIMGANIGTTITAQMVSFNLEILALPAIGIGGLLNFFGQRKLYRYLGQAVLGFGLLFLGLITMSEAMMPLRESAAFIDLLVRFGRQPLLGLLVSALLTAVIQSSSATTVILIAMARQDLLSIESVIPLILGSNIGTCITALLASMGASIPAKKTAVAHVMFNVIGVVVALILLHPFTKLVILTADTIPRQAANAHTLFNVLNTLLILPFCRYFVKMLNLIVPGEESIVEMGSKYLDRRMLKTPAAAIAAARKEVLRMAAIGRIMLAEAVVEVFLKGERKKIQHLQQQEDVLDSLEKELNMYVQELSQHSLSRKESTILSGLVSAANDLERIGDHASNILHLAELFLDDKLQVSATAKEELIDMYRHIDEMFQKTVAALEQEDISMAREAIAIDDVIDEMERLFRKKHIDRLNHKECIPAAGVIYLDVLSNLERVADHLVNLAQVVTGEILT